MRQCDNAFDITSESCSYKDTDCYLSSMRMMHAPVKRFLDLEGTVIAFDSLLLYRRFGFKRSDAHKKPYSVAEHQVDIFLSKHASVPSLALVSGIPAYFISLWHTLLLANRRKGYKFDSSASWARHKTASIQLHHYCILSDPDSTY